MQYVPNVCIATVIIVQYVLLFGLYEYVREVDIRCTRLQETVQMSTSNRRSRRDVQQVNVAENSVTFKVDGEGEKVEFINPNIRSIVEKETNARNEQLNGTTKEEWYWLNAYSRIPVRTLHRLHSYFWTM